MRSKINVELVKDRHEFKKVELHGHIFNEKIRNVTNVYYMQMAVKQSVDKMMKKYRIYDYTELELNLYVTGLTVALVEVINFCSLYGIKLILHHYCKEKDDYYKQDVYLKY